MKLIFCIWVDIHRGTKLVESFLVGVVRHTQACLKYFKIMNQQYLKNEVMYKVDFSTWVDIYRGNILIQSFQVGVGRHVWACPKYFKIRNQQYFKKKVMYLLDFLHLGRHP